MTDAEADRIIGGIIRRWVTTENPSYFNWTKDNLTLDGRLSITPEEFEALSSIGSGEGWWASTWPGGGST